mgnify:CR=1 FL=1
MVFIWVISKNKIKQRIIPNVVFSLGKKISEAGIFSHTNRVTRLNNMEIMDVMTDKPMILASVIFLEEMK